MYLNAYSVRQAFTVEQKDYMQLLDNASKDIIVLLHHLYQIRAMQAVGT